jgi:hypothetical protein
VTPDTTSHSQEILAQFAVIKIVSLQLVDCVGPRDRYCKLLSEPIKGPMETDYDVQGAAEITPTFRKIAVGSPKQIVGCGPFR